MFLRIPARRALLHPLPARIPRRTPIVLPTARLYSAAPQGAAESPAPLQKPDDLDDQEGAIWDLLSAELSPTELIVRDVSGGCGSMYAIDVSSPAFRGLGILKQQRMVNAVLGERVKAWHGVQLRTKAA